MSDHACPACGYMHPDQRRYWKVGDWVAVKTETGSEYRGKVVSVESSPDEVEYTLVQFPDAPTWYGWRPELPEGVERC